MTNKGLLAAICLIAGIPLAAYGLATGGVLFTLAGLALVLAFWFVAWQWIARSGKPQTPIKPAANAAWGMRDQPAAAPASAPRPSPLSVPSPSPVPAERRERTEGGAPRRDETRGEP
jgi:hypothetical protein